MEDDLNLFTNGRRPIFFIKRDDLDFFMNGRRTNFLWKWNTTYLQVLSGWGRCLKVTLQTCALDNFHSCQWGPSGGSCVPRPKSEDPHRRERKYYHTRSCFLLICIRLKGVRLYWWSQKVIHLQYFWYFSFFLLLSSFFLLLSSFFLSPTVTILPEEVVPLPGSWICALAPN